MSHSLILRVIPTLHALNNPQGNRALVFFCVLIYSSDFENVFFYDFLLKTNGWYLSFSGNKSTGLFARMRSFSSPPFCHQSLSLSPKLFDLSQSQCYVHTDKRITVGILSCSPSSCE